MGETYGLAALITCALCEYGYSGVRCNVLLRWAEHAPTDTRPMCTSAVRPSGGEGRDGGVLTTNPNPRCGSLTTLSFFTASSHTCMPLDSSTSTRPRYCRDRREDGIKAGHCFGPHVGNGRSGPGRVASSPQGPVGAFGVGALLSVPLKGSRLGPRTLRSPRHHL